MSEPKFTKGPWTATYDSQLQALIEIYSIEDRILVAVLPDRGTVEAMPEIEANANLIAAAPDMYEVLADMDDAFNDHLPESRLGMLLTWGAFEKARVALRKARGETE